MMATRKLYSIPKAYETVESDELTKEELQHNSRLDKFIKELVNERKAKVVTETKVCCGSLGLWCCHWQCLT
jgi:hypothetical protein